jgi:hypothetical protein
MASIKSIQDILSTYQTAYGAEALMAELALFQKSPSAPSKKIVVAKKAAAEASSSASSVVSEAKEKKVRGPSAWNVYIEKVAGKGKDETPEFSAWKTLQVEKKGNLKMVFAKEQKAADPAGYKSFAEAFEPSVPAAAPKPSAPKAPAPKASVPSSSASVASDTSDKKKAGRPKGSKNKAKDAESVKAESSDSEGEKPKEGEKKKRQWSEEAKKAAAAKRAAKKAVKTPEQAAKKPLPESDDESEGEVEMSAILYEGENLFWNELTGQAFENIDGAMGDLVGAFDGITLTRV